MKLRIDKLRNFSSELDLVVSFLTLLIFTTFQRNTDERKRVLMEIGKFIEWSNADIKSLQFEAKKAPKAKEVELIGKIVFCIDNVRCRDAELAEGDYE